jgi:hypothetical protein
MQIKTFIVNGTEVVDSGGRADWNNVKETPTINITSNAHSHSDRYYTETEVNDRINSLTIALDSLQSKINSL